MATQVPFFQLAKAAYKLFEEKLNTIDSFRKFTGVEDADRKFPIKFIQTIFNNINTKVFTGDNQKTWDKIINQGFICTDTFKNEVQELANHNMNKNIKIFMRTDTIKKITKPFKIDKRVEGDIEVEITDKLEINEYYDTLKVVRMEFKPDDPKPENLDIDILYKFFVFCFMQFYAKFSFEPYSDTAQPWSGTFAAKKPIKDGDSYWLFRSDSRPSKIVDKNGFQVAVESFPTLKTIDEAIKELEKILGGAEGKKIWYRYGQQDLCTETGIALSSNFNDVVVFPLHDNELNLPQNEKDAFFFEDKPIKESKVSVTGGGSSTHVNISYKPPGKKTCVYIMKIKGDKINDTAGQQVKAGKDTVWPEVGMRAVSKDEICSYVTVERWPKNAKEGWFVIKKVDNEDKLSHTIKAMLIKNKLYTYKWTNSGGEVAEVV